MNVLALPQGFDIFGLHIQFYALFILGGALLALFLSSYRAHKKGYSWDFFEIIFFVAFPLGIVGARVWYVIAEWQKEFAGGEFWRVFAIWEGGLAIQGGIIGGVLAGVFTIKYFKKGCSVLEILDFAVPTIFIAQAIGRIGNFTNQEVYGAYVSTQGWNFLPGFITNQMHIEEGGAGTMAAPLFLVEGLINVANYYILVHAVPYIFGKHYKDGDVSFIYIVLYGITRMVMEPLRNSRYQMGSNQSASFNMAIAFIVIGVLLVVGNHLYCYYRDKKKAGKDVKESL